MEIRLRVDDDSDLATEHTRSLADWLQRDGRREDRWETELRYGTNTVSVVLPEEGGAAGLAWSVAAWRAGRSGSPVVVAATADGTPLPEELVRILAETSGPHHGGPPVTVLEPDDLGEMPPVRDSAGRIADRDTAFGGPPGPVLDPDDDWDRD